MKKNLFGFVVFSFIFLLASVSFLGAAIDFEDATESLSIEQGDLGAFTFKIQNDGGTGNQSVINLEAVISDLTGSQGTILSSNVILSSLSGITILPNESTEITVTIDVDTNDNSGTYTGTIEIKGENDDPLSSTSIATDPVLTITLTVTEKPAAIFCQDPNPSDNLRIRSIEITNDGMDFGVIQKEFGDDDEWYLLDDIEIEVEIQNRGDDDIDNIEVEWALFDNDNDEFLIDFNDEKDFDLNDGDEELVTITFNLERALDIDLEDLSDGRYEFIVRATGEDKETDELICESESDNIEIILSDHFVVLSDLNIPETLSCGEEVTILGEVFNIGRSNEDDVEVRIRNVPLGINEVIDVGDIDEVENEKFQFEILIPEDAEEKTYFLNIQIFDEDSDIFESEGNDDSTFSVSIDVEGGACGEPTVLLVPSLESEAKEGENVKITTRITNTGVREDTFTINAVNFGSWANDFQLNQGVLVLKAGESQDVTFNFETLDDVFGEQSFTIQVFSGTKLLTEQPFGFTIKEKSGLSGLTGSIIGDGGTGTVAGIAIVNIILVIIIIIIAVRVTRRR